MAHCNSSLCRGSRRGWAGYGNSAVIVVACIALGMAFAEAMVGPFWAMATSRMAGLSAAAGIAVINSLANLGGYFGPDIIGFFRKLNGGFRGGLLAIGATLALSGTIALIVGRPSLFRADEKYRTGCLLRRLAGDLKSEELTYFHFAQSALLFTIVASPD